MSRVCRLTVTPDTKHLAQLEALIETSPAIPDNKRMNILIIVTEMFDNIAEHALIPDGQSVTIEIKTSKQNMIVTFIYKTKNFEELLEGVHTGRPHFDKNAKRYRGLGLIMSKNLSQKVKYKKSIFNTARLIFYV
ncbi:hypothetical protein HMPREF9554_03167 [Treponema phagedenis F0421]|uniref:ATP-binding protein n=2 Tax=Treponema phagedenis TaxID=162 RepID=UPI0001F639AE|nr:ATP-binding protein [Treponema phagedenis]EFW36359.1 hypothetical protein HMPREF9554_03167 [Treponema phagedenis F0421]TYT77976.1 ATP-binding protein [Treponema phagedenis]